MAATGIYAQSITWTGLSASSGEGGCIEVEFVSGGRDVQERTGVDLYPQVVYLVDRYAEAIVNIRECVFSSLPVVGGAAASLALTIKLKSTTTTRTFTTMVLTNITTRQGRGEPGMTTMRFVHESTDGTTAPE